MGLFIVMIIVMVVQCTGEPNICPTSLARTVKDVFGLSKSVQKGIWHRIPCPAFRSGERLDGVIWYKGTDLDDSSKVPLISRVGNVENDPTGNRYSFSSDSSLAIESVEESDEGTYLCKVIPSATLERVQAIDIEVIGESFAASASDTSTSVSFQRGRRQTLRCQCAPQTPDAPISVVYWSTGEGVTTDTDIIGARFSDGTVLQIQHGADYGIGSDASLTVNSLNDVQNTQRFWCHIFHRDGSLMNCYTDVKISDVKQPAGALKASDTSYYIRKDTQQVVPCTGWVPGEPACEVLWLKRGTSGESILKYNLSTNAVVADASFELASDFGLVFKTVEEGHAGKYNCVPIHETTKREIDVRVIGKQFPLDGGSITADGAMTFERERRFTLICPAGPEITPATKATLIWSYATPSARTTTVIGLLNLPDVSKTLSDLGDNNCFDISSGGSLLMNNCSQNGDVRYWCHVFPDTDVLRRSYVDMVIKTSVEPGRGNIVIIVAVSCACFMILLVTVACFVWRLRIRRTKTYKKVKAEEPVSVPPLDVQQLSTKVKMFVTKTLRRIPITPWKTGNGTCYAPIDAVYTHTVLFRNVYIAGGTLRYRLESESELFDADITELSSSHTLIEGRSGSGKTTFLYKLAYDWAMGRENTLLGGKRFVFVLPAGVLTKAGNIGQAVVRHMLPDDTVILASSINKYCTDHPSDVAILVDGCHDQTDIECVMKVIKGQGLIDCSLVITTRHAKLTENVCKEYSLRHVTNTGFSISNAHMFIKRVFENRKTLGSAKGSSGTTDTASMQQKLDNTETKERIAEPIDGGEPPKPTTVERNIYRYLNEDILSPEITCLPAVLTCLCQLSIWTSGNAFGPEVTMGDLFMSLVKCIFEQKPGSKPCSSEVCDAGNLTQTELTVLVEIGRFVRSKMSDSYEWPLFFSEADFLKYFEEVKENLDVVIQTGLLCRVPKTDCVSREEPRAQGAEMVSVEEISEVRIERGFLCCKGGVESQQETGLMMQDTELIPPPRNDDYMIQFPLKIIEEFCAGMYFTHSAENITEWFNALPYPEQMKLIDKLSNMFAFACRDNLDVRLSVVEILAKIIINKQKFSLPLPAVPNLEKLLELCLRVNFESKCKGSLHGMLSPLFEDGRIRLIGVSSHKIRLLLYLLEYTIPKEESSKLNVKSIKLFRIGQHDWGELREYLEYFGLLPKEDRKEAYPVTTALEEQPPLPEMANSGASPQMVTDTPPTKSEPQSDEVGQPVGDQQMEDSSSKLSDTANEGRMAENQNDPTADSGISSFEVISEKEIEFGPLSCKVVRERIESRNKDMPVFPPDQSDISVLNTVQSLGLQELLDSQCGECYSSRAAWELAQCLPRLVKLESLVLVGTILSSEGICKFAGELDKLPELTRLDIRLNKQFNDKAFTAITNSLHACQKLTDLRLSLYRVSKNGFDHVEKEMEKDEGKSWGRLTTMYLLHGSPAETFVKFLSHSLPYIHFVTCFHISAAYKDEAISETVLNEFQQKMLNPKFMTNMNTLDIRNMESLKSSLGTLKLPKKKKGKIIDKIGNVVASTVPAVTDVVCKTVGTMGDVEGAGAAVGAAIGGSMVGPVGAMVGAAAGGAVGTTVAGATC